METDAANLDILTRNTATKEVRKMICVISAADRTTFQTLGTPMTELKIHFIFAFL